MKAEGYVYTGKPPHVCRNQIAPRLPDECVLWASWDEYNNVDIDIGVDDDAADGCFEHFLTNSIFMLRRHLRRHVFCHNFESPNYRNPRVLLQFV